MWKKSVCKNGKLFDDICLYIKNKRLISECVEDKCKGGKIKNDKCICEKGKKRNKCRMETIFM